MNPKDANGVFTVKPAREVSGSPAVTVVDERTPVSALAATVEPCPEQSGYPAGTPGVLTSRAVNPATEIGLHLHPATAISDPGPAVVDPVTGIAMSAPCTCPARVRKVKAPAPGISVEQQGAGEPQRPYSRLLMRKTFDSGAVPFLMTGLPKALHGSPSPKGSHSGNERHAAIVAVSDIGERPAGPIDVRYVQQVATIDPVTGKSKKPVERSLTMPRVASFTKLSDWPGLGEPPVPGGLEIEAVVPEQDFELLRYQTAAKDQDPYPGCLTLTQIAALEAAYRHDYDLAYELDISEIYAVHIGHAMELFDGPIETGTSAYNQGDAHLEFPTVSPDFTTPQWKTWAKVLLWTVHYPLVPEGVLNLPTHWFNGTQWNFDAIQALAGGCGWPGTKIAVLIGNKWASYFWPPMTQDQIDCLEFYDTFIPYDTPRLAVYGLMNQSDLVTFEHDDDADARIAWIEYQIAANQREVCISIALSDVNWEYPQHNPANSPGIDAWQEFGPTVTDPNLIPNPNPNKTPAVKASPGLVEADGVTAGYFAPFWAIYEKDAGKQTGHDGEGYTLLIVGYDRNYEYTSYDKTPGQTTKGIFLAKNSWGATHAYWWLTYDLVRKVCGGPCIIRPGKDALRNPFVPAPLSGLWLGPWRVFIDGQDSGLLLIRRTHLAPFKSNDPSKVDEVFLPPQTNLWVVGGMGRLPRA